MHVVAVRVHVERLLGERVRSRLIEEDGRAAVAHDLVAGSGFRREVELELDLAVASLEPRYGGRRPGPTSPS